VDLPSADAAVVETGSLTEPRIDGDNIYWIEGRPLDLFTTDIAAAGSKHFRQRRGHTEAKFNPRGEEEKSTISWRTRMAIGGSKSRTSSQ
jgi:hypothetical protein